MYVFFLDVKKAYDIVWRTFLWFKLWDMGVKGRIWWVIKKMSSRSVVLLEGEQSATFRRWHKAVAYMFSVFINCL